MAMMSLRAYARHRGVFPNAVTVALRNGRITRESDGRIDSDKADCAWVANTVLHAPRNIHRAAPGGLEMSEEEWLRRAREAEEWLESLTPPEL